MFPDATVTQDLQESMTSKGRRCPLMKVHLIILCGEAELHALDSLPRECASLAKSLCSRGAMFPLISVEHCGHLRGAHSAACTQLELMCRSNGAPFLDAHAQFSHQRRSIRFHVCSFLTMMIQGDELPHSTASQVLAPQSTEELHLGQGHRQVLV